MRAFLVALAGALLALPLAAQSPRVPPVDRRDLPAGIGIAQVVPEVGKVLHFYGEPGAGEVPGDRPPLDSLRFGPGQPTVEIAEAPPWFVPDHLKIDYEIVYLRALTLTRAWVEVIGNSLTGETVWVARESVRVVAWPEFLLSVSGIRGFDGQPLAIHARPLDESPVRGTSEGALAPIAVRGEWIEVADGWVRWRQGDRLRLRYEPLG